MDPMMISRLIDQAAVSYQAGFSVCVVDPEPLAPWINNYGVWVDEFQAMGLEDCLHVVWPKAKGEGHSLVTCSFQHCIMGSVLCGTSYSAFQLWGLEMTIQSTHTHTRSPSIHVCFLCIHTCFNLYPLA